VQRCKTLAEFLAVIDQPATSKWVQLYSRVRNSIVRADDAYEKRRDARRESKR
jgi:hypothetical protein